MRKNLKSRITLFIIVCTLIFGIMPSTVLADGNDGPNEEINLKKWMNLLPDEMPVSRINLPGTHDSGSYNPDAKTSITTSIAKTQEYNIPEQLNAGVRVFDIRLGAIYMSDDKHPLDLMVHHGDVCCRYHKEGQKRDAAHEHLRLGDVFEAVDEFLCENESETVVLYLTDHGKTSDEAKEILDNKLAPLIRAGRTSAGPYPRFDYYKNGSDVPKLGNTRGRCIVLFDEGSLTKYEDHCTSTVSTKIDFIQRMMAYAEKIAPDMRMSLKKDKFQKQKYINPPISKEDQKEGYVEGDPDIKVVYTSTNIPVLLSPESAANHIIPEIIKEKWNYERRYGWIMMDFVSKDRTASLINKIILSNQGCTNYYARVIYDDMEIGTPGIKDFILEGHYGDSKVDFDLSKYTSSLTPAPRSMGYSFDLKVIGLPLYAPDGSKFEYQLYGKKGETITKGAETDIDNGYCMKDGKWCARIQTERLRVVKEKSLPFEIQWIVEGDNPFRVPETVDEFFRVCKGINLWQYNSKTKEYLRYNIDSNNRGPGGHSYMSELVPDTDESGAYYKAKIVELPDYWEEGTYRCEYLMDSISLDDNNIYYDFKCTKKKMPNGTTRFVIRVRSRRDKKAVDAKITWRDGNNYLQLRGWALKDLSPAQIDKYVGDDLESERVIFPHSCQTIGNISYPTTLVRRYDAQFRDFDRYVYRLNDESLGGLYRKNADLSVEDNVFVYEMYGKADFSVVWNVPSNEIPEPYATGEKMDVTLERVDGIAGTYDFTALKAKQTTSGEATIWQSDTQMIPMFASDSLASAFKISEGSVSDIISKVGSDYRISSGMIADVDEKGYPIRHYMIYCDYYVPETICVTGVVSYTEGCWTTSRSLPDITIYQQIGTEAPTKVDVEDYGGIKWSNYRYYIYLPETSEDRQEIEYTVEASDLEGYKKDRLEDSRDFRYTRLISAYVNVDPAQTKLFEDSNVLLKQNGENIAAEPEKTPDGKFLFKDLLIADEHNIPYVYTLDIEAPDGYSVSYGEISRDNLGNETIDIYYSEKLEDVEIPVELLIHGKSNEDYRFAIEGFTDKGRIVREPIVLDKSNDYKGKFFIPADELSYAGEDNAYLFNVYQIVGNSLETEYDEHISCIRATVYYMNGGKQILLEWLDDDGNVMQDVHSSKFVNTVNVIPAVINLNELKHQSVTKAAGAIPEADFTYKLFMRPQEADSLDTILSLATVSDNGDGSLKDIVFDVEALKFYEEGNYTLYVSTVNSGVLGWCYDTQAYSISFSVKADDINPSQMVATVPVFETEVITQIYATVQYSIPVSSRIDGTETTAEEFEFELSNAYDESDSERIKIQGKGDSTFSAVTYYEPGTYVYYVTQIIPDGRVDWEYDNTYKAYMVNVIREDDGSLRAISKDPVPRFINRYMIAPITVDVHWIDAVDDSREKPYRPDKLTCSLYAKGSPKGPVREITGSKADNEWNYATPESYPYYGIIDGHREIIEYSLDVDTTDIEDHYTVRVYGDDATGFEIFCVEKCLDDKEDISVKIIWDDDNNRFSIRPEEVKVTLASEPDYVMIEPLEAGYDNNWKVTFKDLPVAVLSDDEEIIEISYKVVPSNVEWYKTDLSKDYYTGEYILKYTMRDDMVLWTEDVEDEVFTGSPIKPAVKVYYGRKLLTEGKDYSVRYSNNINVGKAVISVEGKGDFTGKDKVYFNINSKDISENDVNISIADKVHTGRRLVSKPVIKYGKLTLKENRDYTLSYSGNQTDLGSTKVTIKGRGNFRGETSVSYRIYEKGLKFSDVYVEKIPNQVFTGRSVYLNEEDLKVYADSSKTVLLEKDTDYSVKYKNNQNVGTATATIVGEGIYQEFGGSKNVSFKIVPCSLNDADIMVVDDTTYTGKAINPAIVVYKNNIRVNPKYFSVKYSNNKIAAEENEDKAPTVTIVGKGNYTGQTSEKFSIFRRELNQSDVSVTVPNIKDKGKAITAADVKPMIKFGKIKLEKGKDYIVDFSVNKDALEQSAVIEFIGNYSGSITCPVRVYSDTKKMSLEDNGIVLTVADAKHTGRPVKPKVTVVDTVTGKKLSTSCYTVTYSDNVDISKTAPMVTLTGKGDYTGTISKSFRIYEKDITKCVFGNIANQPYTGKQVKPSDVVVTVSKRDTTKLREGIDYEITYGENIKAGRGTVTVTGKGAYGGSKTLYFTIIPKFVQWLL